MILSVEEVRKVTTLTKQGVGWGVLEHHLAYKIRMAAFEGASSVLIKRNKLPWKCRFYTQYGLERAAKMLLPGFSISKVHKGILVRW